MHIRRAELQVGEKSLPEASTNTPRAMFVLASAHRDFTWPVPECWVLLPRYQALLISELKSEDLTQQEHFRNPRHFCFLPPAAGRTHSLAASSHAPVGVYRLKCASMPSQCLQATNTF